MAHPQVVDEGNSLHIWRAAVIILIEQLQTGKKEWSSSLGVVQRANNSL
jgi:hypothetical protein